MKEYFMLCHEDGTLFESGRPQTIRVYETLSSAKKGRTHSRLANLTIVKFTSNDIQEVSE